MTNRTLYLLEDISRSLDRLHDRINTVEERLAAIETKNSIGGTGTPLFALPDGLSPVQQRVFKSIDAISATDATSRQEAQAELRKLEGNRITEPLVVALKNLCKQRDWRLQCPKCGQPAMPLWQRNSSYRANGCLEHSHYGPSGEHQKHAGRTKMYSVTLVGAAATVASS